MEQESKAVKIVVKRCGTWSSSTSRSMRAAGRAASNAAIMQATEMGVPVSYLKDGVVHFISPEGKKNG